MALMTIDRAAEHCGISVKTLTEWTESGYAPHYFLAGEGPLYKQVEIKQWVNENLLERHSGMPVPRRMNVLFPIPETAGAIPPVLCGVEQLFRVPIGAPCSGIYFLCEGEDVVYVGQAVNVMLRVAHHVNDPTKQFDVERVFFIPCPREILDEVERHWIALLQPRHNRIAGSGGRGTIVRLK